MTLPVILDAGPILTFFAANQERLLISVVGPLAMPRTVHDEVEGKAARGSRFSAAAGVLRKLRGSRWLTIREDDCTDSLSAVVERTTGRPFQKRGCHAQNVAYTFLYVSPQEDTVKTMSYSESRARYAEVLDSVVDDCEEVVITRAGREPAVIVSLAEYQSLKETDYLLRNPANAKRLMESITSLEAGRGAVHELIELD